jgi:hypothetical protein
MVLDVYRAARKEVANVTKHFWGAGLNPQFSLPHRQQYALVTALLQWKPEVVFHDETIPL